MKALDFHDGEVYLDKLVDGKLAIRANLEARLSIIRGEYMMNTQLGVPLGAIKDEVDLHVQSIILETAGVTNIIKFESELVDKRYKCRFTVDTIYGGLLYE